MGAATLFKQHAWLALLVFGGWLVFAEGRRVALLYGLSALCLPLVQWLILGANVTFDSYLYWNWTFNLSGTMDGVRLDGDLFRKLLLCNVLVFPFALEALHRKRHMLPLILMWLATLTLLYPRFGEIHAMGHLPFTALMSGPGGRVGFARAEKHARMGHAASRVGWHGAGHQPGLAVDRRGDLHSVVAGTRSDIGI